MLNDSRFRDTARSRLSSTHNEPAPISPRVQCDGCQLVKVLDARLANLETVQRADGLDLAELTGSVMASIEGLRREINSLSDAIESQRVEMRTALGLINESRANRATSDSFPAKPGTVEAKLGDKWRFRGSGIVAIFITLIVVIGYVAHSWGPPTPKQQTTQSGK